MDNTKLMVVAGIGVVLVLVLSRATAAASNGDSGGREVIVINWD